MNPQSENNNQEKLAQLGTLTAGIAHELQNPLNFIINFAKVAQGMVEDMDEKREDLADISDSLAHIVKHAERASHLIQSVLLYTRAAKGLFMPTDITQLAKEYVALAYHSFRAQHKDFNVAIREDYQEDIPPLMLAPADMARAILNITNNAFYAIYNTPDLQDPAFTITVKHEASTLVITLHNNGEPMTEEAKRRIYDKFYTTKPAGQGTGLGMPITKDIVENIHHGSLTFKSTAEEGTTFTINIPKVSG